MVNAVTCLSFTVIDRNPTSRPLTGSFLIFFFTLAVIVVGREILQAYPAKGDTTETGHAVSTTILGDPDFALRALFGILIL
jgi:hypothetical protein